MENNSFLKSFLTGTSFRLLGLALLLLRFATGTILFIVGAGKVMGWFGGMGMKMTVQIFGQTTGIPEVLVYISSYTEFIGGLLLIAGLFTRPAAFAVMINMLVATIVTWPKGFITGGASYPFTLMICAVVIQLAGPLAYSIDSLLFNRIDLIHKFRQHRKLMITA